MSDVQLVPAVYRCPDHDNVDAVTERVRERVGREALIHADRSHSPFRVSVTCPGVPSAPQSAHTRVYDGTWAIV